MGNLTVGLQVDYVLTSETVKAKTCRIKENTFMSTDHKAVFLARTGSQQKFWELCQKYKLKHSQKNLNDRCKDLQFDEGLTKAAAILLPKETGAQHLDKIQPYRMSDNDEKTGGVFVADDTGKDPMRILPDSVREQQPAATRSIQHLDSGTCKIMGDIPLVAAQIDFKKSSTMWTETKH